jgi:hypothetical protein
MTLAIKKIELQEFSERWFAKAAEYKGDELSNYFDKFFTLFVIYNRMYNVVVAILDEQGEIKVLKDLNKIEKRHREPPDNKAATVCVAHFLRDELGAIIDENTKSIEDFKVIIDKNLFNIDLYYGQPQPEKDRQLLKGLNSKSPLTIVESLLIILYKIRCNVFHAEKGYNQHQKIILDPANSCIYNLSQKLSTRIQEHH